MASPTLSDISLKLMYGMRSEGIALFDACEWGYHCPKGHCGFEITWSEFKEHIWCYECDMEYPTKDCPLQWPSWMKYSEFMDFVAKLPFKPIILRGRDSSLTTWTLTDIILTGNEANDGIGQRAT